MKSVNNLPDQLFTCIGICRLLVLFMVSIVFGGQKFFLSAVKFVDFRQMSDVEGQDFVRASFCSSITLADDFGRCRKAAQSSMSLRRFSNMSPR